MAESLASGRPGAATDVAAHRATIAGGRGRTGYGTGADDADDRRVHGHVRACARPPRQADPVDSRADAPRLRLHRQRRRLHPTRRPGRRAGLRRGRAVPLRRQQRRVGYYRNFERCLELVPPGVRFVALSDQDDVWHADKLETLASAFDSERVQLAYADMAIVSSDGEPLAPSYWTDRANNHTDLASLLLINTVTGAASLFRRELLDVALPFPDVPGSPSTTTGSPASRSRSARSRSSIVRSTTTSSTATTSSDATNRSPGSCGAVSSTLSGASLATHVDASGTPSDGHAATTRTRSWCARPLRVLCASA